MSSMSGKVAIVTGGSSGIGRVAAAFAKAGAKVVVAARREAEGAETVRLVQEAGSEWLFIKTDVTQAADCQGIDPKSDRRLWAC